MVKNIGWMTFMLCLGIAANGYRRQSLDQAARNLAASSDQKIESMERSIQAVDDNKLTDLRKLTQHIKGREQP